MTQLRPGRGLNIRADGESIHIDHPERELVVAQITGNGGPCPSTGASNQSCGVAHSWIEMAPSGKDGCGYVAKLLGRTGSLTNSPAYEINGNTIPTGTLVFLRERGMTSRDMGPVYDVVDYPTSKIAPCTTTTTSTTPPPCSGQCKWTWSATSRT
jgi:hypothetical protein